LTGVEGDSLDQTLLRKIASETGGTFHRAAQTAQSLQDVYATLDRTTPRKVRKLGWSYKQPLYIYPLATALIAMVWLLVRIRTQRERHD
ncbi:MAG: hypothetical protein ACRER5_06910, partial [Pseudomonas sp.]